MNRLLSGLWILAAAGFACTGTAVWAQPADQNLSPVAPYVAPVPANADWVLHIVPASATSTETTPSADVLKEIHLTQIANLRRVVLVTTDGGQQEFYFLKGYFLFPASTSGKVMILQETPSSKPYPYYSKGYYGVDWIKLEYFTGVTIYKNTRCFHYKGEMANPVASIKDAPVESGKDDLSLPSEAWIDCSTRLPVAVMVNGDLIEFVHNPSPAQLVMSPAYEAVWKVQENQLSRLNALKVVR